MSYASREPGEMWMSLNEAETLGTMISNLSGTRYDIRKSLPDFPPHSDETGWYLLLTGEISKVAHARTVWVDKEGRLLIESMSLGDTVEWIELEYGEEGAVAATNPGDSDLRLVRRYLAERFPLVDERLAAYQTILDDISLKRGISLAMRVQGTSLVATFFMDGIVEVNGLKEDQKSEQVGLVLKGLQEAMKRISKYHPNRHQGRNTIL